MIEKSDLCAQVSALVDPVQVQELDAQRQEGYFDFQLLEDDITENVTLIDEPTVVDDEWSL